MKSRKFIFSILSKGQIVFLCLICILVFSSAITLDAVSASTLNSHERSLFTVVIDPGHGGLDPGSIGYKTKAKESEINLAVSLYLYKLLENFKINVILTRNNSDGLYGISSKNYKKRDMQKRKDIINAINPDIVVSVHMNSYVRHNLRGAQVFYDKHSKEGEQLALCIQDQFSTRLPASDKGISIGDYYMLKCTAQASVIAECGFLSNEEDEKLLISKEYQQKLADCIFKGIVTYLNKE